MANPAKDLDRQADVFTKALRGAFLVVLAMLGTSPRAVAQMPPHDGTFVKVCSFHGEADSGAEAWHRDERCELPTGFMLDRSYRQQSWQPTGGGATTNLSVSDIPAGLHIVVSGNHYWSVVAPLELVRLDDDGPARRQFRIHTYCGPEGRPGPGCSVHVDVYARRR